MSNIAVLNLLSNNKVASNAEAKEEGNEIIGFADLLLNIAEKHQGIEGGTLIIEDASTFSEEDTTSEAIQPLNIINTNTPNSEEIKQNNLLTINEIDKVNEKEVKYVSIVSTEPKIPNPFENIDELSSPSSYHDLDKQENKDFNPQKFARQSIGNLQSKVSEVIEKLSESVIIAKSKELLSKVLPNESKEISREPVDRRLKSNLPEILEQINKNEENTGTPKHEVPNLNLNINSSENISAESNLTNASINLYNQSINLHHQQLHQEEVPKAKKKDDQDKIIKNSKASLILNAEQPKQESFIPIINSANKENNPELQLNQRQTDFLDKFSSNLNASYNNHANKFNEKLGMSLERGEEIEQAALLDITSGSSDHLESNKSFKESLLLINEHNETTLFRDLVEHQYGSTKLSNNELSSKIPTENKIIEQVSLKLVNAVQNNSGKIQVQLEPQELGKVEISLKVDNGNISKIDIVSEKFTTLDALQQHKGELKASLQEIGIKSENLSLNFGLKDFSSQQHNNQNRGNNFNQENFNLENINDLSSDNFVPAKFYSVSSKAGLDILA